MNTLKCIVERITFQNEENGYAVIKVKAKGYDNVISVTGYMASVNVGSVLQIQGEWKFDNKYGRQFNVVKYNEFMPASVYGIEKYLGSGLIKGIGTVYAKKIVDAYKEETLNIIEKRPDKLLEIEGIGKKRVEMIKKSWIEQKEIKNVMIFLQEYGVSTLYAAKIFKCYGNRSIEVVKNNPYKLADDIWGIGFKTADTIAMNLGIDKESFIRCRSGILYTLNQLSSSGHCFATMEQLVKTAVQLLDIEESKIIMSIDDMKHKKDIICENERLYLPSLFYSEVGTSKLIKKIINQPRNKKIEKFYFNTNIEYDEIQKESIKCAANSKFMVLTGGPGTGKTTTTIGIIDMFVKNGFEVLLTAPTGRAAKRMNETTGIEAKTIHRLLEFKPPNGYQKNENNTFKADVLIIDESSMIDIVLMYNLLKAVPSYMSVILVGDSDQLPSVGAGNVLIDIINSEIVPVIRLEKIYRQANESYIIKNAHKINKGEYPEIKNNDTDFFFLEKEDNSQVPELTSELLSKRLPNYYKVNPVKDIQVLCPMQNGDTGTINMNIVLQSVLNKSTFYIMHGGYKYYLNDKVMQIKNNYDKEVYNGDIGVICDIDIEEKTIKIDFENKIVKYELTDLDEIVLAYAVTIHKSQGSEYPIVVIPLTMSHYVMLQRNLIYTGITRAKRILVLVGSKKAIFCAINNNKVEKRNTSLKNRLREYE